MNIHERLKYLREQLNLTTRAFGSAINMSGGSITNMEKGTRNITDRTIRDICREYHVNMDWLLHGKEPIFIPAHIQADMNDDIKQLTEHYLTLTDNDRKLINQLVYSLAEKSK